MNSDYYCTVCGSVIEITFDNLTFGEVGEEVMNFKVKPCGHCVGDEDLPKKVVKMPLSGTTCSVCGEKQIETPGGLSCSNGHGGAPPEEHPCPQCAFRFAYDGCPHCAKQDIADYESGKKVWEE